MESVSKIMGAPNKYKSVEWTKYNCPICNSPMIKTNSPKWLTCYWGCASFIIKASKIEEVKS